MYSFTSALFKRQQCVQWHLLDSALDYSAENLSLSVLTGFPLLGQVASVTIELRLELQELDKGTGSPIM